MNPKIHGHARSGSKPHSRTYQIWSDMKRRCLNPKRDSYPDYGGRGITLCPEWHAFTAFLADMGEAPPGLTLDRRENNEGYHKNNCRWITVQEQEQNRRDTVRLTYKDETRCVADWERILGFAKGTVQQRVNRGWTSERALTTPVNIKHRRKV